MGVCFEAIGWALVVQLLAMLESGAEITGPTLWIPWGILAAIIRYDRLVSRPIIANKSVWPVPSPAWPRELGATHGGR